VVDFGTLPGGVQIRCVTEPVSSGFDALTTAGFSYTGTQRFPGLLCRIDGKPADAPCVHAPPPDRYWAYWIADAPGGAWTYSDLGAGNRTPPPGSVEGWAFSDGCTRAPQGPPCPTPTTTTTRPPTTTTGGSSGGTGGGSDAGSSTSITSVAGTPAGRETTTTERSSTTTTSEVPSGGVAPEPGEEGSDADGTDASAAAAVATQGGGGSPLGAVVGLGMAAGLVALAAVAVRRRRTSEGEPA
jgi:hypothetical protein